MVRKLREVLLAQYIGAMVVALLVCQAVISFVHGIIRTVSLYIEQSRNQSVFGSNAVVNWMIVIQTLVSICFYLLVSYSLARWLYPAPPPSTMETES